MKPPVVSIIVPVWKPRRTWLVKAVESALNQRGCLVDLIVVDDGNDEPVRELLSEYVGDAARVISIDHGGPSAARNAGLTVAQGQWIRFLDADDVLELDSTANLLRLSEAPAPVIAYGVSVWCNENLIPFHRSTSRLDGWAAKSCLLGKFDAYAPAMLFPSSVVKDVGAWDPTLTVSEDWDFVLRALEVAPVRGDDRDAFYYRRHEGSASDDSLAGRAAYRRVVEKYFDRNPGERNTSLHRKAMAQTIVFEVSDQPIASSARRLAAAGLLDPITVARHLARAVLRRPLRALRAAASRFRGSS